MGPPGVVSPNGFTVARAAPWAIRAATESGTESRRGGRYWRDARLDRPSARTGRDRRRARRAGGWSRPAAAGRRRRRDRKEPVGRRRGRKGVRPRVRGGGRFRGGRPGRPGAVALAAG